MPYHAPLGIEASDEQWCYPTKNTQLCYETFGDKNDPPILLISDSTNSMLSWRESFIRLLTRPEQPRYVIRYDLRDTGGSTCYDPNPAPLQYARQDLVEDAVYLINHLELRQVHLVGLGFGGSLAYEIADTCRAAGSSESFVKSLTILWSSPVGHHDAPDLPPLDPGVQGEI
ncbi:Alpha/Beta hydrolase protein [Xylariales sp. AK1849]|nr:Alpha/Beta hydrolase protein [Xylariales sp. AK1849]